MEIFLRTPRFLRAICAAATLTTAAGALATGCDKAGGDVQINSIDPTSGALQGEQPVRVEGKNFRTDIGYTVYFGNQRANQVTILDDKTLLVVSPSADAAGPVDITIRADDGAAFRIAKAFKYEDMAGNVVEQFGAAPKKGKKGNLAY